MLKHPFIYQAYDLPALLKDTNKISTFCSKLEKQSTLHPDRIEPDTYKGNGLELLVELLLKASPIDSRFGVTDYTLVSSDDDVGVDGHGIGTNGKPATVQVKYRATQANGVSPTLTANRDHLSNFTSSSMLHYGVDPTDQHNMLVITTGEGLHHYTDNEMFGNKVKCIGYKQLQKLLDNNLPFWNMFRQLTTK